MSKNHYKPTNNMQGMRASTNPIDETNKLSETDKEAVIEQQITEPEVEELITATVSESDPEPEQEKSIIGIVTDCLKLRVRKQPNTAAEVLCEIDALSEVQIDEKESTEEFYKVCTEAGIEGFCMKKFIAVKQ